MYKKKGEWRKGLSCKKQTTTLGKGWSTKVFLHLWWRAVDLGHQQHWIRARGEELIEECAKIICKHISSWMSLHHSSKNTTTWLQCPRRYKAGGGKLQSVQNCRWALVIVIHACWRCTCIYCHGACSPLCSFFFNFRLWACTNPHSHSILSNKKGNKADSYIQAAVTEIQL